MIPQETVNRILDAAQIVDVVGDFVTLKKRGANHIACCPFSVLIEEGLPQPDRLVRLNEMAIRQMEILSGSGSHNLLK